MPTATATRRRSRRSRNAVLLLAAVAAGCASVPRSGWEDGLHRAIADRADGFAAADVRFAGFAPLAPDAALAAGDEVLFGVCLEDGDERRIWYLRVRVAGVERMRVGDYRFLHPFEQRVRRRPTDRRGSDSADAQSSADRPTKPLALEDLFQDLDIARILVETFDGAGRPLEAAESLVLERHLREGLIPACVAGDRLRDVMAGRVAAGLDADMLELGHTDHDAVGVVGGGVTSCEGFLRMLRENPVTRAILEEVIDLPSWWSIIGRFGVRAELAIDFFAARRVEPWQYPGSDRTLWSVPVTLLLNDEPAWFACLVVGPAGAPDGAAAGVFGMVGRSPSDPARRVFVQVLASRRGGDASAALRGSGGSSRAAAAPKPDADRPAAGGRARS